MCTPEWINLRDAVERSDEIRQATEKVELEYGIRDADRVVGDVLYPDDITSLSANDVGKLHWFYEGQLAYIRSKLAVIEVKVDYGKHLLKTYKAQVLFDLRQLKVSYRDCDIALGGNQAVQDAEKALMEYGLEQSLLCGRSDIFTKYASAVSREISRRKAEGELKIN